MQQLQTTRHSQLRCHTSATPSSEQYFEPYGANHFGPRTEAWLIASGAECGANRLQQQRASLGRFAALRLPKGHPHAQHACMAYAVAKKPAGSQLAAPIHRTSNVVIEACAMHHRQPHASSCCGGAAGRQKQDASKRVRYACCRASDSSVAHS